MRNVRISPSLQVNIFPNEKTFALRYQTTDMLETILRQGVLGEDDIREEFPKERYASKSIHIMDPKGIIEMILIFLEERGGEVLIAPCLNDLKVIKIKDIIRPPEKENFVDVSYSAEVYSFPF
ncbi:hypothetical protein AgCh_029403 [Apium graveolens]